MSKEKKNGRREGLWYEIIIVLLLIGLSMMLGIRLYRKEWVDAFNNSLWIVCWMIWYKIWKDSIRCQRENRHLRDMIATTVVGLSVVKHVMEKEGDDKKNDGSDAGAQNSDSQTNEEEK